MEGLLAPAGVMITARVLNIGAGLLLIPILLLKLGAEGFGAWAVLLAASVAFSTIEIGMPATLVKYAAGPHQAGDREGARAIRDRAMTIAACAFALAAPLVATIADPVARLLRLPATPLASPGGLLVLVFSLVALRSILQLSTYSLYAARRFRIAGSIFFAQPFLAHCAAILAAAWSARLDLAILAFWAAQLALVSAVFIAEGGLRFRPPLSRADCRRVLEMCAHGLKVQVNGWSQLVNFQFDKFVIAAMTGLTWVVPYEVANRSVAALRSIPASGIDTFLPAAASLESTGGGTWEQYAEMTRIAGYSVLAFMLAPLVASPMFLYAWLGEPGIAARFSFATLLVGAMAIVLTLPAQTYAQATGNAGIQARAALTSIMVNIPLSLLLISRFGFVGGAVGTSIAMLTASVILFRGIHRRLGWSIVRTLGVLSEFLPCAIVGLVFAAATFSACEAWFSATSDPKGHAGSRLLLASIAAGTYVVALALALLAKIHYSGISKAEFAFLGPRLPLGWLRAYCERRIR